MQEGKEITRRNFIKLALAGSLALTGCAKAIDNMVTNTQPVETESFPVNASNNLDGGNKVLASATPEAKVTPTVIHLENAGGPYTAQQEALNNSDLANKDKDTLELWVNDYWTAPEFKNRPFEKNSKDLHIIFVYDDLQNPTEVKALLQATGGDYIGRTFTVPFGANGLAEFPPKVEGDYIREGYGPLELTAGNENWRLSVENGVFVRRDKSSNEVVERLDYVSRQWTEVETKINMEKFNRFPQSYEAFLANSENYLESPDPISQREEFDRWLNEKYIPVLGSGREREVNIKMSSFVIQGNVMGAWAEDSVKGSEVIKLPHFFYFKNEGKKYSVLVFNVEDPHLRGKTSYTMALILCDGEGRAGTKAISKISSGEKISDLTLVKQRLGEADSEINKFIDAGIIPVAELTNDKKPPIFGASIIRFGQ
jgi:hypothetical protein